MEDTETLFTLREHLSSEQVHLLLKAIDQSSNAISITDSDGHFQFVNQSFTRLSGYTPDELEGKTPAILNSGLMPKETYSNMWSTITDGQQWNGEVLNRHKSGNLYWASLTISPIHSSDGKITHYLGVEEDITQRKLVEQQLKEATSELQKANQELTELDQLKNELLGIAAHDLRSPLSRISLSSEVLMAEHTPPDKLRTMAEIVHRTAMNMTTLLNEILDFTKIESGSIKFNPTQVDIESFFSEVVDEHQILADQKNIKIELSLDASRKSTIFDPKRMQQLMGNLLSNALKFSEANTKIHVNVTSSQKSLKVEVVDQGPGIKAEELGKLFEPFEKLSNKPTNKEASTGLGLAICKKLVELHSGEINVSSEFGKGAKFYFTIPQEA